MDWRRLVESVDAESARALVLAARRVIDALLIEAERVRRTQTPPPRDYNAAELPRESPAGWWLEHSELRATAQELSEAVAAEKWTDGLVCALKALFVVGGLL
jgi:hypothetical protein